VRKESDDAIVRERSKELTRDAPGVVKRILALSIFGGGRKAPKDSDEGESKETSDPAAKKAWWGGALQAGNDG
jgi:hypothetical protein